MRVAEGKGHVLQGNRIRVVNGPEHLGRHSGIGRGNREAAEAQPRGVFLQGDRDPSEGEASGNG